MNNSNKSKKKSRIKKRKVNTIPITGREPFFAGFFDRYRFAMKKAALTGAIVLVIGLGGLLLSQFFTIDTVIVEGNIHYSDEAIQEMILGGRFGRNSLYISAKYHNKQVEGIPFVETMDVKILSPNSVKITVYEKSMAGYVEHMGQYFYFDKDGTVVESSSVRTLSVPQIKGLHFDHIVLMEKLPVEDQTIFHHILDISQLLGKYGISAEQIYFDKNYAITLYFGDAKVKLGSTDYIDEKIMKLKMILPNIEGKSGVLRMENYTSDQTDVTFELEE